MLGSGIGRWSCVVGGAGIGRATRKEMQENGPDGLTLNGFSNVFVHTNRDTFCSVIV